MDFLTEALGGSAQSAIGSMVKTGAEAGRAQQQPTGKGFDLSNLLSSNATLGGVGGPFGSGGSLEAFGNLPMNSGQEHQLSPPRSRRPSDDFLGSLFM